MSDKIKAMILLYCSLLFPLLVHIIPDSMSFSFLLLDISTDPWSVSINPGKQLSYDLNAIWPFLWMSIVTPVYISVFMTIGQMKLKNGFNVWWCYLLYHSFNCLDYMLTFMKTPLRIPLSLAVIYMTWVYFNENR